MNEIEKDDVYRKHTQEIFDNLYIEIQKDMKDWYDINLSIQDIEIYVRNSGIVYFDTIEREDYVDYLARDVTGMNYPLNGSDAEYKQEFFKRWDGAYSLKKD